MRLHAVQRLSGMRDGGFAAGLSETRRRMAIVVPCRDEPLATLEGVLGAIPSECLVILLSNSGRGRFEAEARTLLRVTERSGLAVHQRDTNLSDALVESGFGALVDETGRVRPGKGEGMLVGVMLAHLAGKDFVGFVDADNRLPTSVTEYVDTYAAGFQMTAGREAMVRIRWRSKPKVIDGSLVMRRSGRVSETTNRYLNRLVSQLVGRDVRVVETANAGEHAMTVRLALQLRLSGGFSIETQELLDLMAPEGRDGVDVLQIETFHPHIHMERGGSHVESMRRVSLGAIYHSPLTPDSLRRAIEREVGPEPPPPPIVYPPLAGLDWDLLSLKLRKAPEVTDSGQKGLNPDHERE